MLPQNKAISGHVNCKLFWQGALRWHMLAIIMEKSVADLMSQSKGSKHSRPSLAHEAQPRFMF